MRYLVTARVKPGMEGPLADAIERGTLGRGSIAGDEYLRNMECARLLRDGTVRWVEVCYCPTPLQEERPYWEAFFDLVKVQDAHARSRCRDLSGEDPWACSTCDCTERLEARLGSWGVAFLPRVLATAPSTPAPSTPEPSTPAPQPSDPRTLEPAPSHREPSHRAP